MWLLYYKLKALQMRMDYGTFCIPLNIIVANGDISNRFVIVIDHVPVNGSSGDYLYAVNYW